MLKQLKDDFKKIFEIRNGSCSDAHCFADVHLSKKLNYDQKSIYTLNVIAFDGAGRSAIVNVAKFPIVINVADVENNPPRFITDIRIAHVPEDAPLVMPPRSKLKMSKISVFFALFREPKLFKFKQLMAMSELFIQTEFCINC